ncbi:MAG: helix-turn-helix transcriptional regulator [Clostridia bacterium]|nr:helix-turn-helix transcriptional regulator [Clostridia bacterium]
MDPVKCGNYLKTLRKEKGLTQEQLAEMLGVSNRSVSRWETGANLPDIDIIIILSEYYDVDIRDILDGENRTAEHHAAERSNEKMLAEEKEVIVKAVEYGSEKERGLARKVFFAVLAGVAALAVSLFAALELLDNAKGSGVLLFAGVLAFTVYCMVLQIPQSHRSTYGYLVTLISGFAAVIVSSAAVLLLFFASGNYHNYGIAGLFYSLGMIALVFTAAGLVAAKLIKKKS